MSTRGRDALLPLLKDRGWTPGLRDVPALLGLLGEEDEDLARDASRAVMRVDAQHAARVAELVAEAARPSERPARARIARLAGDLARANEASAAPLVAWLLEALRDGDPKTRRAAARALGKVTTSPAIEAALLAAFEEAASEEDRRPLAEALGKVGGEKARAALAKAGGDDRALVRARIVLEREATRANAQTIAREADLAQAGVRAVRWQVRRGLEGVLTEELVALGLARKEADVRMLAPGLLEADVARGTTFDAVLAPRIALDVALPLGPAEDVLAKDGEARVAAAVARALARPGTLSTLQALTDAGGAPIRFRVAFRRGGHQRATAWKIAELVREGGALVNDPTASTWEVVVDEQGSKIRLELVPRGHEDTRFSYRGRTVPASSHPTIAAALVRVSPRRDDEVMWDPFTGAGAELVERAKIGPYARLVGTDVDEGAVEAARANLDAAAVRSASVTRGDALFTSPAGVTAIVSNPPMGRRVQRGGHLTLLERFVEHAAEVLAPGGTLTWIVPEPRAIAEAARVAKLELERTLTVDMGGFAGELMVLRKPGSPPRPSK